MGFLSRIFGTNSKQSSTRQTKKVKTLDNLSLQKQIDELASKYFSNLHKIEIAWKELRDNDFPANQRDQFWQLCNEGRRRFWEWISAERKLNPNYCVPPNVPCYKRAVMLLEHEKRWQTAIDICTQAIEWIETDWYRSKIEKFKTRIKKK